MFIDTNGLVLREVRYKESDRILTLLSDTEGKITVTARGALSKKSRMSAATQQLTYSQFVLDKRNGRYYVKEATLIEAFSGLRENFSNLALASYFAECAEKLCLDATPELQVQRLVLNSLYALSHNLFSAEHIKAAFELRLMAMTGYQPDLSGCRVCGNELPDSPVFCLESGCVCCRKCRNATLGNVCTIDGASLEAMRYILSADIKLFLSYKLQSQSEKLLSSAAEAYILSQSAMNFGELNFWKKQKDVIFK